MRFHADGPNIPFELLEARDRSEVIFLCGAGVSIPAGLPSFEDLARLVVADLGVPGDGVARQLLEHATGDHLAPVPLDQVFDQLTDDYGAPRVEAAVARRLRPRRAADLSLHRIVRRLSADEQGRGLRRHLTHTPAVQNRAGCSGPERIGFRPGARRASVRPSRRSSPAMNSPLPAGRPVVSDDLNA